MKRTILLLSLLLLSCNEYDLEKDYCGYLVVGNKGTSLGNHKHGYIVLKDNKYKTIYLPEYYDYKLGDTICGENKTKLQKHLHKQMKDLEEQEIQWELILEEYVKISQNRTVK